MPLTLFDSTSAADLPDNGDAYGAYVDGSYKNLEAVKARFPGKPVLDISAIGAIVARCYDVEPGAIWPPADVIARVRASRAAGLSPVVYCGRANWPAVIAAFAAAGEPEPVWWIAHYTNVPHFCSTKCMPSVPVDDRVADATQYGGDLPGHYDVSVVVDDFFASLAPHPEPVEDSDVWTLVAVEGVGQNWAVWGPYKYKIYAQLQSDDGQRLGYIRPGPVQSIDQFALDRMVELPTIPPNEIAPTQPYGASK
jgi:hypothetical protein